LHNVFIIAEMRGFGRRRKKKLWGSSCASKKKTAVQAREAVRSSTQETNRKLAASCK